MTRDIRLLLKTHNTAFQSGDMQQYSAARTNLRRGIRDAKAAYRQRIEGHFSSSDPRQAWQGIRISPGKATTAATCPAAVSQRRSS